MARFLAILLFCSLYLLVGEAEAEETPKATEADAVALYDEGQRYFKEERFKLAASHFKRSYEIAEKPLTLFAWAQAERLSLACHVANNLLRRFLETEKNEENRAAIHSLIEVCDDSGKGPAADEVATPASVGSEDTFVDRPGALSNGDALETIATGKTIESRGSPWYKDPLADTLLVGGTAAVGMGIGFWITSRSALKSAQNGTQSHDDALADFDRAKSRQTLAIVAGSMGAAMLTGAIVRLVTRKTHDDTVIRIETHGDGVAVSVGGGF